MQAYRIVNWWKYEMLKNGKLATAKTKMVSLRMKPLIYVRFPVHGHTLTADYRRMVKRAGEDMAAACDGLYKMLVGLAGNQFREYRGWILDDRQQPMNPAQVAELLCLSEMKVSQIFDILLDREVKWIEILDFPKALNKSLNNNDLTGVPKLGESGKNQEQKGSSLIETETEEIKLNDSIRSESNRRRGVREKTGEIERDGETRDGEDAGQPQARPQAQASASDSDTGTVPASVSQRLPASASDSEPASDSDSVPGPGAGPGAGCRGDLSKQDIFDISRECKTAVLEFSQIIHLRNSSDITTINDIFSQLQQRMIAKSPYPLFELSLNTARQCWRGNNPIAMFVAAMKKPPFYYVPKKLSVIPGRTNVTDGTKTGNLKKGETDE